MPKAYKEVTDPFLTHLSEHLTDIGLTRAKLAVVSGVSVHTMNTWYQYDRSPRVTEAVKICEALGLSLDYLVTGGNWRMGTTDAQVTIMDALGELSMEDQEMWATVLAKYRDRAFLQ